MLKLTVHTLVISGLLAGGVANAATAVLEHDVTKESKTEMSRMDKATADSIHDAAQGKGIISSAAMEAARDAANGIEPGKKVTIPVSKDLENIAVLDLNVGANRKHAQLLSLFPKKIAKVKELLSGVEATPENKRMANELVDLYTLLSVEEISELTADHTNKFFNEYDPTAKEGYEKGLKYAQVIAADHVASGIRSSHVQDVFVDGLTLMYMVVENLKFGPAHDKAIATKMCWI